MSIRNYSEKTRMSNHNSLLVRMGFEPATSRSADRRLSNWANGRVPYERKFLSGMVFSIYEVVCVARTRIVVKQSNYAIVKRGARLR